MGVAEVAVFWKPTSKQLSFLEFCLVPKAKQKLHTTFTFYIENYKEARVCISRDNCICCVLSLKYEYVNIKAEMVLSKNVCICSDFPLQLNSDLQAYVLCDCILWKDM